LRLQYLQPDWEAPSSVRAVFTLRGAGTSLAPYASLNLGSHVGDDPLAVIENRRALRAGLELPSEPIWLSQVHGARVVVLENDNVLEAADAAVTRRRGRVCAVLVADCLPVLFATRRGDAVAVAHAGWRGLVAGVLESTVTALDVEAAELTAWLGPAISAAHFEVAVRQLHEKLLIVPEVLDVHRRRSVGQCDVHHACRCGGRPTCVADFDNLERRYTNGWRRDPPDRTPTRSDDDQ